MTTECTQVPFEFHGLFQRKVKARFDVGTISSDAGALLLREVEKRTGLLAGLAGCFRDRRDSRLIEHTVGELLGQRVYGLCPGYEDLNDHDQRRTDPMLAVAVDKADPLRENRRQVRDRGKTLAGKSLLNRLELTGTAAVPPSGAPAAAPLMDGLALSVARGALLAGEIAVVLTVIRIQTSEHNRGQRALGGLGRASRGEVSTGIEECRKPCGRINKGHTQCYSDA